MEVGVEPEFQLLLRLLLLLLSGGGWGGGRGWGGEGGRAGCTVGCFGVTRDGGGLRFVRLVFRSCMLVSLVGIVSGVEMGVVAAQKSEW